MRKILVSASALALLIGVIHYEPPVGSSIETVQQHSKGCPRGNTGAGVSAEKYEQPLIFSLAASVGGLFLLKSA